MTKQDQLDALEEQIIEDNICPVLASGASRLVFGDGSARAEVVFIGEAPGKKEDETGKPFVGAAGKFLDEMLDSVGLSRKDIYITNIVKYRPPNNRDPLPEEKKEFWPYLLDQIRIIRPKVVITLGRHSGQAFNPSLRISADHGKPTEAVLSKENDNDNNQQSAGQEQSNSKLRVTVLPLYHPAAALYNGSLRETLLSDFKAITRILNKK